MGKERNKDKNKDNIFKTRKEIIMLIIIIIIIILIDQLSKLLIQNIGETDIIPNVLNLKISTNSNMQNKDSQNTYIITNLIIIFIVSRFMISQNKFVDKKLKIFLSFILAGGISNLIERISKGYVTQFINLKPLPILNIADIFVIIGWISVVAIFTAFTAKEWKNRKENKE